MLYFPPPPTPPSWTYRVYSAFVPRQPRVLRFFISRLVILTPLDSFGSSSPSALWCLFTDTCNIYFSIHQPRVVGRVEHTSPPGWGLTSTERCRTPFPTLESKFHPSRSPWTSTLHCRLALNFLLFHSASQSSWHCQVLIPSSNIAFPAVILWR